MELYDVRENIEKNKTLIRKFSVQFPINDIKIWRNFSNFNINLPIQTDFFSDKKHSENRSVENWQIFALKIE